MIEQKHEACGIYSWLGREALRTAESLGRDTWLSIHAEKNATTHSVRYTKEQES